MNWSLRLVNVAGIRIRIHVTFFLILFLGAYQWAASRERSTGALRPWADGAAGRLGDLARVGAQPGRPRLRRAGARDRVAAVGGVAQITKNPEKPVHEMLIAIAGPLVNIVIAGILVVPLGLSLGPLLLTDHGPLPDELANIPSLNTALVWLFTANLSLVMFNLNPAFPLDGGRVLRALLAMFMGLPRATSAASAIGQLIAVLLGVCAVLSGHFILALVAALLVFGAGVENSEEEAKTVRGTLRVGDAYNKHALTLAVGDGSAG